MSTNAKSIFKDLQKAFNTGVSYMMPSVVVGGIFLAVSLATGEAGADGLVVTNPFLQNLGVIGSAGFAMMIPLLSGYIAYSLAGKPGIVPGMITGYIANNPVGDSEVVTGFLGAMILGVLTGYVAMWVKKWKIPVQLKPIMPILVIPIVSSFIVCLVYIYVIAQPIGSLISGLVSLLSGLQGGNAFILGAIIGAMTAVDMGGPINKTATAFTLALMAEGIYSPNGAHRIAVAIPPLAMALSTIIDSKKYTEEDRGAGISAGFMGLIGITEGAIPFAAKDLKRVLPAIIIGSAVGGGLGMLHGVETLVPHGGLIVIGAVNGKLWYFIDMLIGTFVAAGILHFIKPEISQEGKKKR